MQNKKAQLKNVAALLALGLILAVAGILNRWAPRHLTEMYEQPVIVEER